MLITPHDTKVLDVWDEQHTDTFVILTDWT